MTDKKTAELLDAIGRTMVDAIKAEMVAVGLADSLLIDTVKYSVTGYTVSLEIADYYKYVESGRKPGAKGVPIEVLIGWMKRKGIARGNENRVAWAIQSAIRTRGIKPRPFLKRALYETDREVDMLIGVRLETLIDEEFKKLL